MQRALIITTLTLFLSLSSIFAQNEASSPWTGHGSLGGSYLQGNTDLFNIYGAIEGLRDFDQGSLILGVEGAYGESNDVKNSDWFRGYAQYNYDFNEPYYGGLFADILHDDLAELNYRVTVNPLLGYYVFNNERGSLALEAGPAYVFQEQLGITDSFFSVRFAERFTYNINERTRIWQSLEYLPELSDLANYLLIGEAGIQTWVGPKTSLKAFVQDRFDSDPEAGLRDNDFGFYLTLGYGETAPGFVAADSATPKPPGSWNFTGTAGGSILSGNTEATVISGALSALREGDNSETGAGVYGGYSENSGATNAQQLGAYLFHNVDIDEKWYAGGRLDFLHDQIAEIDYRFNIGPHVGYRLIDTSRTKLNLELGPGYTIENQGGVEDSYATVRFGEYLTHQLNDTIDLYQSFEYFGSLDDSADYYLVNKAGFDAKLFSNWSWTNAFIHTYDNTPVPGLEESDISFISGLKWTF